MAKFIHGTILPFFLCYIFLITSPMGSSSLSDFNALMQLKKSFENSSGVDSWGKTNSPCGQKKASTWDGILCENGLVMNIHLENFGLSGKINVDALIQMKGLRVISFEGNNFSGPIPEFNQLGALKAIFLSRNQFSGEIPPDFFEKMGSLKKVWLDENKFTGKIPLSLEKLENLTELHLENNQFSGPIPALGQHSLDSLDLANNNLEGEIPSSLSNFNETSFQGNPGLCGDKINKPCEKNIRDDKNSGKTESSKIAIGLMVGAIIILFLVIIAICLLRRQQKNFNMLENESIDDSVEEGGGSRATRKASGSTRCGFGSSKRGSLSNRGNNIGSGDLVLVNEDKGVFGLTDLMKAGAEVLGNGALGSCYKAMMSNGMTVVVKRIKDMNKMGRDGFDSEIRRLGRLRHPNVLTPLGYHYRKEEKLLVSEYASKGNLLYLLHGDRGPSRAELNWPTRLKIVGGITRGLSYLHDELSSIGLPHGNLKSSNVVLVPGFEPLLVDYGFSPLLTLQEATQALHAYKSPEAENNNSHQVSVKSDIHCLGVIILEILTGKFHCNYLNSNKGGIDVVHWVMSAVSEKRESEVIDPEVLSGGNVNEVERLLHIGASCVEKSPEQRPELREVLRRIEEIERESARTMRQGSHVSSVQAGGYGSLSGRRIESFGARSDRRNSDNLAFDIS